MAVACRGVRASHAQSLNVLLYSVIVTLFALRFLNKVIALFLLSNNHGPFYFLSWFSRKVNICQILFHCRCFLIKGFHCSACQKCYTFWGVGGCWSKLHGVMKMLILLKILHPASTPLQFWIVHTSISAECWYITWGWRKPKQRRFFWTSCKHDAYFCLLQNILSKISVICLKTQ